MVNITSASTAVLRVAAAAIAVVALSGIAAAPSYAAPASGITVSAYGDGTWAPSHEESTRVIPLCKGPQAVADWLNVNFSDHGDDIAAYIERNSSVLTALASGNTSFFMTGILLSQAVLQIPSYAISDALFHLPASTLAVATGCGYIEKTGINPFSVLNR